MRKRLALEIQLALLTGGAWEEAAIAEIRRLADGPAAGLAARRLSYISAQEWLGGMRDADELDQAMQDRTKRLGRLGNAVVPQCGEWIGRKILEFAGELR